MRYSGLENNAKQMKRKQEALRERARSVAAKVATERKKSIRWTPEQLKRATGPMVYVWWGLSENPLYIGMSGVGITRCMSDNHHNSDVRQTAQSIEFFCCATKEDAIELERELIRYMKPQYNKMRY